MDLRILEIASNTENNKIIDNFTHRSKNKNPITEYGQIKQKSFLYNHIFHDDLQNQILQLLHLLNNIQQYRR